MHGKAPARTKYKEQMADGSRHMAINTYITSWKVVNANMTEKTAIIKQTSWCSRVQIWFLWWIWHVTALSLCQLVFRLLYFWWRIAVGGRDRSPEGAGRGEEETDCYVEEQTLAHEEEACAAQVNNKNSCACLRVITAIFGDRILLLFSVFGHWLLVRVRVYDHSCHVHVMSTIHC